jgi:hypothetical protein
MNATVLTKTSATIVDRFARNGTIPFSEGVASVMSGGGGGWPKVWLYFLSRGVSIMVRS